MRGNVVDRPTPAERDDTNIQNDSDENLVQPAGNAPRNDNDVDYVAPVVRQPMQYTETSQVINDRNRTPWGPIWAGVLSTVALFLIMEMLVIGAGWVTLSTANGNVTGTDGGWVTGLVALIAFFIGGWISGLTTFVRGNWEGLLVGFLVWALGTALFLAFAVAGLGSLFGAVGNLVAQLFASGTSINLNGNLTPNDVLNIVHTSAWGAFWTLLVTLVCAMAGSWLGLRMGPIGELPRRFTLRQRANA